MAKQTINIDSGELAGDGESPVPAFDKINDNFDEVYTGSGTHQDLTQFLGGNLDPSGNDITGIGNLNIQVILQLQDQLVQVLLTVI